MLVYENSLPSEFNFLISINIRRQIREYLITEQGNVYKRSQFNFDFFSKSYFPYYLSNSYDLNSKTMNDGYIIQDFEINKEKRLVFLENKRKNEENDENHQNDEEERIFPMISYKSTQKDQRNHKKHKKTNKNKRNQSVFKRIHEKKGNFEIKIPIHTSRHRINDRIHNRINKNKGNLLKFDWNSHRVYSRFELSLEDNKNIRISNNTYTKISIPKEIINKSMINTYRILINKEDIKYNENRNEEVIFEIDIDNNYNQINLDDKYIQIEEEKENMNDYINIDNCHSKDIKEEKETEIEDNTKNLEGLNAEADNK